VAESSIPGSAFAVVHRRRGIATALKRAQISWAAANGYRKLVTSSVDAWIVVQGPAR
jgi:GNAT superfamily N-acetyltransferase